MDINSTLLARQLSRFRLLFLPGMVDAHDSLSGRLTGEYLADGPSDACQVLDAHLGNRF